MGMAGLLLLAAHPGRTPLHTGQGSTDHHFRVHAAGLAALLQDTQCDHC